MTPECLDGIELRRVGGQPFHRQAICAALLQATHGRAMRVQPIEHHDQRAAVLLVQGPQILHQVGRADVAPLHRKAELYAPEARRDG